MTSDKKTLQKLIPSGILLLLIIIIFFIFTRVNHDRIIAQNKTYVEDATRQTTQRVDDLLTSAGNSIYTIASLYSMSLTSPEVDLQALNELAENSPFEYIEFVNEYGISTNSGGRITDVSNRDYFIQGINGGSGMAVVFDSRITVENLVIFYTPLYYENRIIGVLAGYYNEEQMREILSVSFFGEQARTYLCLSTGEVISCSTTGDYPTNILDPYGNSPNPDMEEYEQFSEAFQNMEDFSFNYDGSYGIGTAYIMKLPSYDWMIMQTFPSKITNRMISDANDAGILLEFALIVLFVIYIIILLLFNRKQRRQLLAEKQEMSHILDNIILLFSRFIIVDFEKNTYEYLKKTSLPDTVSAKGSYSEFLSFWDSRFIDNDENHNMHRFIQKDYIQEHLNQNTPYLQYEYRIMEEEERWKQAAVLCLRRKNGVAVSVLYAIQDITDLKREELRYRTALKEACLSAEHANRAKSDFLSSMSHDIRTPMNAIMGMTSIAAMHLDEPERIKDCLNKISVSSRHLLGLINEVLDMSKIESGTLSLSEDHFRLPEVIESVLTIVQPQIGKKHQQLKVNLNNLIHEDVIGDSMRLQQVFINIMGNAVKFTPEGGTLVLSINELPSGVHDTACYEFIFEDNGIGMEKEFIERIFEPFSRARNSSQNRIEGTGLGLAITKNIVQMMNGTIQAESILGTGSRFTVTVFLKLSHAKKEAVEFLKGRTILVVDDDLNVCQSAYSILTGLGMTVESALSGREALEKLQEAHNAGRDCQTVLINWKMPEMDGLETARQIRALFGEHNPGIILTAYDYSSVEKEAREAGVNAFTTKPLFRSRLISALTYLVTSEKKEADPSVSQLQEKSYDNKRVLLVEDNELNMEIAMEILSATGLNIETAYDGKQALDLVLEKPAGYFNLILMDIQMPNMNGYEATAAIRSSGRADLEALPIIAMSADAFTDDIRHAGQAGMNAHVSKPIDIKKLLQALDQWL